MISVEYRGVDKGILPERMKQIQPASNFVESMVSGIQSLFSWAWACDGGRTPQNYAETFRHLFEDRRLVLLKDKWWVLRPVLVLYMS